MCVNSPATHLLKTLSRVCELPDVTEAKDAMHLHTLNHRVQGATLEVLSNDLAASNAEADLQQAANLLQSPL